jgi:endonuclease III
MKANVTSVDTLLSVAHTMFPHAECELVYQTPFQLAIAVILSAQTTDVAVNRVTPTLFERYPDASTLAKADLGELEEILKTIGLFRNKAKNIKALAQHLVESYHSSLPEDFDTLVQLPGIGRKTANVIVAVAFHQPGLAVDTHVLRVTQRLGIVAQRDTPTQAELKLKRKIPKTHWSEAHHAILFFGRYHCTAKKPACSQCPLAGSCKYHQHQLKTKESE